MDDDIKGVLAVLAGLGFLVFSLVGPLAYAEHVEAMAHIEAGHCQLGDSWLPCSIVGEAR